MFCCTLHYAHSSFAIILMGKRELVALFGLSSRCLVIVVWLFLAVPWVCLQFVIVVFPDHTHLLFFQRTNIYRQSTSKASSKVKRHFRTSYKVSDVTKCAPHDGNYGTGILARFFCILQLN